ncbi:manganese efflux pump MntP [Bacillus niameyensis]|uniref:manganese efflux pump MntP n=1 Tax=Bacillus niameyensis TaxID=1522308 RepID=UPI000783543D|nr:manganese efflux pump MntP family protein [Bacillus niameyensis]
MAFAVGMDAFSISLGMGVYKIRLRRMFYIGLVVGLFHLLMPLVGILMGHLLSGTFGQITIYVGGILLVIIGMQMAFSSFRKEEDTVIIPTGWGLFLFSLLVSIDSFSAGLSLGIFGVKAAIAVICFAAVSIFLTWSGLLIGRKIQSMLGAYAELLGGVILISFGIKLLLPFPW